MKNLITSILIVTIALLLSNCGENFSADSSNKYLGKSPGYAKNYESKISQIEEEAEEASSLAELEDIDKQRKELKKEAKEKLSEIAKSLNLPKEIPFEVKEEYEKYKVNNLKITDVMFNQIELTAEITSKVTRSHMFAYLQAIDKQGNPIESSKDWVILDNFQWRNAKEGEAATMKGYYRGIEKLENLEKFVFRTREEYENNK